ncbi:MAG: lysophospholipid acyltransferase family protein [Cyanobacteria bacterium J06632_22]
MLIESQVPKSLPPSDAKARAPKRDGSSCPVWASRVSPWLAPLAYALGRWIVLPLFFKDIKVMGLGNIPHTGAVLLAPTHRSRWDSLLVGYVGWLATKRYLRFMVTADECLGLQGWLIKRLGGFPVHGKRPAIATLRHGVALLRQHQMLVIFPEGDIFRATDIQPLKPGLSRLALQAESSEPGLKVKVVPIHIGYNQACPVRGSRAYISIGEPLETTSYAQEGCGKAQAKQMTADLKVALERLAGQPTPRPEQTMAGSAAD